ncbi:MAG: alpha/beta hydrolase [Bacteroidota bacterium]|nr:alpha/beta hydrolase [Bacteroidota bacterium]MDP4214288.1 alpha/beta hydrolase [Bacteroidota bacterium]MDP4249510.1 alpha/beta hydrolase [Bacteroidota bacterium]
MNLYFISGLGADRRVFQKLIIPRSFVVHHIDWIPVVQDETLSQYCEKLAVQINQAQPFILIGLSFGGIIAIELSKQIKPLQTILISSISSPEEVGRVYIVLGKLRIQRIIPIRFLLMPSAILFRLFGAHTKEEKMLMKQILADTDPDFFRWSLKRMFSWKNEWKPERLVHIHGTSDKILPYNEKMQAIRVEGGEHLMVYSKFEQISGLLQEHLLVG